MRVESLVSPKTNIMTLNVYRTPYVPNVDFTLEVVEGFTYLASIISSNLSLYAELNKRIGKASTSMARLTKRGSGKHRTNHQTPR